MNIPLPLWFGIAFVAMGVVPLLALGWALCRVRADADRRIAASDRLCTTVVSRPGAVIRAERLNLSDVERHPLHTRADGMEVVWCKQDEVE